MNRKDLQTLSFMRVREGKALLDSGHYAGAYYLVGYSVECAVKACIAKQTKRFDFPDKALANDAFTHDLTKLLKAAGLWQKLDADMKKSPLLATNWAIVKDWSETARYEPVRSEPSARDFYSACTARKTGILSWLKKYW